MGGAKVLILILKCNKDKSDDVCGLSFSIAYNDTKNAIDDKALALMNQKAGIAKVFPQIKDNVTTGFRLTYFYVCKGFTDLKFIGPVLEMLSGDIPPVLAAYNSLGALPAK